MALAHSFGRFFGTLAKSPTLTNHCKASAIKMAGRYRKPTQLE